MRAFVIVAALVCSTATAQAQYANRIAASGKQIKLSFFAAVNPDCSAMGDPTVRITQDAEHGRVTTPSGRDFPSFSEPNVRTVCNTRRVQGRIVSYTSER